MSLHQLANHMSAQGRGRDSTLVHMTPREVSGLQSLAMAHGGTLTINPETGLPEAGFLDSILPTLLGGAATFFSGGTITPFMAALGVGGLTALTSKDLGKGLMAGLGAYGGSGIMEGLVGFGAADIGEKAISSAAADATAAGYVNGSIGLDPSGIERSGADAYAAAMQKGVGDRMAGASYSDKLKAGFSKALSNPGDAFNAIGGGSKLQGAAMLGAPLLSALATQDQTSVPTAEQIKFDPRYANINISRSQRPYQPDTGSSGERRYFGNTYVTQYADGGAVSNDGIQHFAYGGGTIDPTYDYSGYGPRSNSSGMRPIAYAETAKPDFVGADGKTYRYDPIKKSWYVIKEAEEKKVNAGVETLMDGAGGGPGGNVVTPPSPFTPIKDNGLFASIWGRTTQDAAPVVTRDMYTPSAQAEREARLGRYSGLSGLQARQAETDAEAALNAESQALEKQTHINLTTQYENALQEADAANKAEQAQRDAANKAEQAQRDAVTSASSPTATGGKANSPGIASLGVNLNAGELSDRDPATTTLESRISALANNARAAQAVRAADDRDARDIEAVDEAAFAGAQQAQEAQAQANREASTSSSGSAGGTDFSGADAAGTGFAGDVFAYGGMTGHYAQGGLGSLGGYSDGGRLLRGPGDGVSDSIPASIGDRQPARLANNEFVIPARIVSEIGNGSTDAGAKRLYQMMDRIQNARKKSMGKGKIAVDSKAYLHLPA